MDDDVRRIKALWDHDTRAKAAASVGATGDQLVHWMKKNGLAVLRFGRHPLLRRGALRNALSDPRHPLHEAAKQAGILTPYRGA